ncbi:MAG: hypothetical protein OEV44_12895 [Spirochaetota bacterium]|nr:hypothetical protein [Spirochaetota bacterium]
MKLFYKFIISLIAVLAIACGNEKPQFVVQEDFTYLKRPKNHILLILRLRMDSAERSYDVSPDSELNNIIKNYNFQIKYRGDLAKELIKWDSQGKLKLDFDDNAEEESFKYFEYIGNDYPKKIKRFDLILEVDIYTILTFENAYINVSKKEKLRLIDNKTGKLYLSSYESQTFKSIGQRLKLKRNKTQFIRLLQQVLNQSTTKIVKYILNLEKNPDESDITPIMPEFKY